VITTLSFEDVVRPSQKKLKKALVRELKQAEYTVQSEKGFIYAKGDLPVLLVAHLDTVHKQPVKTICYSADKNIIMSPQGIGGDDRAGVFMITGLIQRLHCHVLFCEDEEIGGIGARSFVQSGIKPAVNFIIELDRRGSNDAVFYDCDNPEFTSFVTDFGFVEDIGSFSDISVIAPALGVAAVNISAGYFSEHTKHEYVDLSIVKRNIERVGRMIAAESKRFEYIEAVCEPFGIGYLDFGRCYAGKGRPQIRELMPLPENICLQNGELKCDSVDYLMDENGTIYEYLWDMDVAVEA
jgi:hypothetical protein